MLETHSTYLGPRNKIVDSTFINKFNESLVFFARPTGRGQLLFVALSVSEKRDFNESICSSLNLPLLDICDLKKGILISSIEVSGKRAIQAGSVYSGDLKS